MMLIDTHAHLDFPEFAEDLDHVLLIAKQAGVESIITIGAWTQLVNFNGRWMRMKDFLWERFRVRVSHGISEEAFEGVMGMVGKGFTVSDSRSEKLDNPKSQPDADSRH
jgi:hypothetical protein